MARENAQLVLERQSHKRRRLADAARLLPVLAFIMLLLPALWTTTASALIYIFSTWAILILVVGLISKRLSDETFVEDDAQPNDVTER